MLGYGGLVPPTTENYDKDLCKVLNSRWQASRDHYRGTFMKAPDWYRSFKMMMNPRLATTRNNVVLPYTLSVIETDLARKVTALFGSYPIVGFEGQGPNDGPIAKKNEALVSAQMKDMNILRKGYDFCLNADVYGTGCGRVGWTNITRIKNVRQQWLDKIYSIPTPVTMFDGPDFEVLNLIDLGPQPGKKYVDQMRWFMYRYYVDFDDLWMMNQGPLPPFRREALEYLKEHPMQPSASDEYYNRFLQYRDVNNVEANRQEEYGKPVCIKEMVGFVPSEFAKDGLTMRLVSMANDCVILRNDPNPYDNDRIPIIASSPVHDTDDFFGIGKAQVCEKLQDAGGKLLNTRLDGLDLWGNMPWIGDSTRMPPTQNLQMKPGRVFMVRGNPAEILMPLRPDMTPLMMSANQEAELWSLTQKGTGITEDGIMGITGSTRKTKAEFVGQQEAAMTRLSLESFVLSNEMLEPLAEWMRDMNAQWLSVPKQLNIIGSTAMINPVTGLPMPQEAPTIYNHELNHNFKARAFGPMMMLTKGMARADALQLAQVFQMNPVWIQMTNWAAFAKKIYNLFDWDANEMLVSQLPQINQFAQESGMSPQQFLGQADNPMANLPMNSQGAM